MRGLPLIPGGEDSEEPLEEVVERTVAEVSPGTSCTGGGCTEWRPLGPLETLRIAPGTCAGGEKGQLIPARHRIQASSLGPQCCAASPSAKPQQDAQVPAGQTLRARALSHTGVWFSGWGIRHPYSWLEIQGVRTEEPTEAAGFHPPAFKC